MRRQSTTTWPRFSRRDAVFVTDSGPFYGREAIEKFRVGLFKEWHFCHHLIKTDPNSPRVRHVEVSLGTAREVNPVLCGREEGAKARMVINNTRPEYGLHHGHNIVLVTVSEVSAENLAMKSTVELLRRIQVERLLLSRCHSPSLLSMPPTRIRMPLIHFWGEGGNNVLAKKCLLRSARRLL